MKTGKIIKTQKDIYYLDVDGQTYLCKARGNFRVKGVKPLVGDRAEIEVTGDREGYIKNIIDRKNEIKRPNIANVDQLLLFVTIKNPPLNLLRLDKYLSMCEFIDIDVVIILSKSDLASEKEIEEFREIYQNIPYELLVLDNYNSFPKDRILAILNGKTSALSGASGVGKSTFLNNLVDEDIEIGSISEKLKRGKNTTRHTEIFKVNEDSYIFDTPGFDSFDIDFIEDEADLKYTFKEFDNSSCKFNNCNHINEPQCKVKEELDQGLIAGSRYENYLSLFNDIKKRRENKW
ncbi:MAG: ribosome small subunit-dependent GTPase A [Anaerococcus sp.]|nr:ribosome small subunit-dependent GTPase A [Anaerococcus sp.]MDD7043946.1 ribosome small subunit-dependent GTPase A [Peptoniphilaceae bacterium]MDY2918664.1 ribosome small subunit-dependent GTPase A [Anaerococcus sp.]